MNLFARQPRAGQWPGAGIAVTHVAFIACATPSARLNRLATTASILGHLSPPGSFHRPYGPPWPLLRPILAERDLADGAGAYIVIISDDFQCKSGSAKRPDLLRLLRRQLDAFSILVCDEEVRIAMALEPDVMSFAKAERVMLLPTNRAETFLPLARRSSAASSAAGYAVCRTGGERCNS